MSDTDLLLEFIRQAGIPTAGGQTILLLDRLQGTAETWARERPKDIAIVVAHFGMRCVQEFQRSGQVERRTPSEN